MNILVVLRDNDQDTVMFYLLKPSINLSEENFLPARHKDLGLGRIKTACGSRIGHGSDYRVLDTRPTTWARHGIKHQDWCCTRSSISH